MVVVLVQMAIALLFQVLQVDLVVSECVDGSYSWCFGTGWTATSLYAPDKDAAMRSIEDIRAVLDGLAP